MDDDKFRSYRDRDPVAREGSEQTTRGGIGDLLAESWLGSLAKAIPTAMAGATAGLPG